MLSVFLAVGLLFLYLIALVSGTGVEVP